MGAAVRALCVAMLLCISGMDRCAVSPALRMGQPDDVPTRARLQDSRGASRPGFTEQMGRGAGKGGERVQSPHVSTTAKRFRPLRKEKISWDEVSAPSAPARAARGMRLFYAFKCG
jgi:hypothetical protein